MFLLGVLCLAVVAFADSTPKLSETNVLLPRGVGTTVSASAQCWKWSTAREDVVTVRHVQQAHCPEGTSGAAHITAVWRGPARAAAAVTAVSVHGGKLRVDVWVAQVAQLEVTTSVETLAVRASEKVGLLARDEHGNTFTSLEGLKFTWQVGSESTTELQLSKLSVAGVRVSAARAKAEHSAFADAVVLTGRVPGVAHVAAKLLDSVSAGPLEAQRKIKVLDRATCTPAQAVLMPGTRLSLQLFKLAGMEDVLVQLPAPHMSWQSSAPNEVLVNQGSGLAAVPAVAAVPSDAVQPGSIGTAMVHVRDDRVPGDVLCDVDIAVSRPVGMDIAVRPMRGPQPGDAELTAEQAASLALLASRNDVLYLVAGTPYQVSMSASDAQGRKFTLGDNVQWAVSLGGAPFVAVTPDATGSAQAVLAGAAQACADATTEAMLRASSLLLLPCTTGTANLTATLLPVAPFTTAAEGAAHQRATIGLSAEVDLLAAFELAQPLTMTAMLAVDQPLQVPGLPVVLPQPVPGVVPVHSQLLHVRGGSGAYALSGKGPGVSASFDEPRVLLAPGAPAGSSALQLQDARNIFNALPVPVAVAPVEQLVALVETAHMPMRGSTAVLVRGVPVGFPAFTNCSALHTHMAWKAEHSPAAPSYVSSVVEAGQRVVEPAGACAALEYTGVGRGAATVSVSLGAMSDAAVLHVFSPLTPALPALPRGHERAAGRQAAAHLTVPVAVLSGNPGATLFFRGGPQQGELHARLQTTEVHVEAQALPVGAGETPAHAVSVVCNAKSDSNASVQLAVAGMPDHHAVTVSLAVQCVPEAQGHIIVGMPEHGLPGVSAALFQALPVLGVPEALPAEQLTALLLGPGRQAHVPNVPARVSGAQLGMPATAAVRPQLLQLGQTDWLLASVQPSLAVQSRPAVAAVLPTSGTRVVLGGQHLAAALDWSGAAIQARDAQPLSGHPLLATLAAWSPASLVGLPTPTQGLASQIQSQVVSASTAAEAALVLLCPAVHSLTLPALGLHNASITAVAATAGPGLGTARSTLTIVPPARITMPGLPSSERVSQLVTLWAPARQVRLVCSAGGPAHAWWTAAVDSPAAHLLAADGQAADGVQVLRHGVGTRMTAELLAPGLSELHCADVSAGAGALGAAAGHHVHTIQLHVARAVRAAVTGSHQVPAGSVSPLAAHITVQTEQGWERELQPWQLASVNLTWHVDLPDLLQLHSDGHGKWSMKALAPGRVQVRVSVPQCDAQASCTELVSQPLAVQIFPALLLLPQRLHAAPGAAFTLQRSGGPALHVVDHTLWYSSDEAVVSVDAHGRALAHRAGTAVLACRLYKRHLPQGVQGKSRSEWTLEEEDEAYTESVWEVLAEGSATVHVSEPSAGVLHVAPQVVAAGGEVHLSAALGDGTEALGLSSIPVAVSWHASPAGVLRFRDNSAASVATVAHVDALARMQRVVVSVQITLIDAVSHARSTVQVNSSVQIVQPLRLASPAGARCEAGSPAAQRRNAEVMAAPSFALLPHAQVQLQVSPSAATVQWQVLDDPAQVVANLTSHGVLQVSDVREHYAVLLARPTRDWAYLGPLTVRVRVGVPEVLQLCGALAVARGSWSELSAVPSPSFGTPFFLWDADGEALPAWQAMLAAARAYSANPAIATVAMRQNGTVQLHGHDAGSTDIVLQVPVLSALASSHTAPVLVDAPCSLPDSRLPAQHNLLGLLNDACVHQELNLGGHVHMPRSTCSPPAVDGPFRPAVTAYARARVEPIAAPAGTVEVLAGGSVYFSVSSVHAQDARWSSDTPDVLAATSGSAPGVMGAVAPGHATVTVNATLHGTVASEKVDVLVSQLAKVRVTVAASSSAALPAVRAPDSELAALAILPVRATSTTGAVVLPAEEQSAVDHATQFQCQLRAAAAQLLHAVAVGPGAQNAGSLPAPVLRAAQLAADGLGAACVVLPNPDGAAPAAGPGSRHVASSAPGLWSSSLLRDGVLQFEVRVRVGTAQADSMPLSDTAQVRVAAAPSLGLPRESSAALARQAAGEAVPAVYAPKHGAYVLSAGVPELHIPVHAGVPAHQLQVRALDDRLAVTLETSSDDMQATLKIALQGEPASSFVAGQAVLLSSSAGTASITVPVAFQAPRDSPVLPELGDAWIHPEVEATQSTWLEGVPLALTLTAVGVAGVWWTVTSA